MDVIYCLLKIQNQSWFFPHKEFFIRRLRHSGSSLEEIFKEWLEQYPDMAGRWGDIVLPRLRLPSKVLLYGCSTYPKAFYGMMDPPLVLTLFGEPCWREPVLSVVGSRKPTAESLRWISQELGAFLDEVPVPLVSGGARGVDQAVHALSIRKRQPTIAFIPGGLGAIYPSNFVDWARPIMDNGGCIVSEYFYDERMRKDFFYHRNRLIAQIGIATLIVQASAKSGTIMTGHLATECGQPVWVLPGHPLQKEFSGNIQLLQEGACMISNAYDLSLFYQSEILSLNLKLAQLGDCISLQPRDSGDKICLSE